MFFVASAPKTKLLKNLAAKDILLSKNNAMLKCIDNYPNWGPREIQRWVALFQKFDGYQRWSTFILRTTNTSAG